MHAPRPRDVLASAGRLAVLAGLAGVVMFSAPARPSRLRRKPFVHLEPAAKLGGAWYAAGVEGNLVVAAKGRRVVTVDISDLDDIRILGKTGIIGDIRNIGMHAGYAYALDSRNRAYVIDVTDPANPRGVEAIPHLKAFDLVVKDGHVYFVGQQPRGDYEVSVYSLADPRSPARLGASESFSGWKDVALGVQDGFAYVSLLDRPMHIEVVDVSEPVHPRLVQSVAIDLAPFSDFDPGFMKGLVITDGAVSVMRHGQVRSGYHSASMSVLDVFARLASGRLEHRGQLELAGGMVLNGGAGDHVLAFQGFIASAPPRRLYSIDVSQADAPKVSHQLDVPNAHLRDLVLREGGTQALLAADRAGLRVVELAPAGKLTALGALDDTFGTSRDIAVAGGLLFNEDWYGQTSVHDLSDPLRPRELVTADEWPGRSVRDAVEAEGLVFAIDAGGVLHVLDPSSENPAVPIHTFTLADDYGSAIAYANGHVLLATMLHRLAIVDVRDPSNMRLVKTFPPRYHTGEKTDVEVKGSLAYVARDEFLTVYDVADPAAAVPIGRINLKKPVRRIAVHKDHVFVTTGEGPELLVIDVSSPGSPPRQVASVIAGNQLYDIAILGDIAVTADRRGGMKALDVSDPAQPKLLEQRGAPGWCMEVVASDSHFYVSAVEDGVWVLPGPSPDDSTLGSGTPLPEFGEHGSLGRALS